MLHPLGPDELLEEDLATAALDLMALERGYVRDSGLGIRDSTGGAVPESRIPSPESLI